MPNAIYEYIMILVGQELAQKFLDILMYDLLTENGGTKGNFLYSFTAMRKKIIQVEELMDKIKDKE